MRIAIVISFLFCGIARANPIALALPAEDRIYMSSEHLTASISPDTAEFQGTFLFQYRQDVSAPGRRSFVLLEIPIWFPETHPTDTSVAEFWKVFRKDYGIRITQQTRILFEKAVGLHVSLGGESVPVEEFWTLTSTNRYHWAPREWQQETGFCCLIFRFYFQDDSVLTRKPLTISYRQPLFQADGVARFFYLPIFQNLPKGASTADTNRYSITVIAKPNCSLTVSSGDQRSTVEAGHSVTLSPRHYQAIRAVTRTRPNMRIGCRGTSKTQI